MSQLSGAVVGFKLTRRAITTTGGLFLAEGAILIALCASAIMLPFIAGLRPPSFSGGC